ncbi:MAG: PHP domain-containing protein [Thermodesulfobacteriota bacterium]
MTRRLLKKLARTTGKLISLAEPENRKTRPAPLSPEIKLIDPHVHTRYSDGQATVRQVEEVCLTKGIGCCVTDHNEIKGSLKLCERGRVPTLPALEVGSREQIELIVYFHRPEACEAFFKEHVEPYRRRRLYAYLPRSLADLLSGAFEHEVIVSVPHPFAPLWKNVAHGRKRRRAVWEAILEADCLEVFNGALSDRANLRALQLCRQLGKIPLGGSDSHQAETIGTVLAAFRRNVTSHNLFDSLWNGSLAGILGREDRPGYIKVAWGTAMRHSRKFFVPSGLLVQGEDESWREAILRRLRA